ncbi:manganese efflux pump [Clostridium sp. BJN0001]|uniref:manganese efflux pump MntP n=1 Tax=Clostridium sp. BJN0001 TaxID=2930219 RepID=UPI001FCF9593|nr:manganese efflux pump [Clostridium sp. BJN0001]
MDIKDIFIIALALSMDAFGVSLAIGLNKSIKKMNKIKFILSFAIFQFLFSYIGGIAGHLFDIYIMNIPSIVGGIVILIVGIFMIVDGFKEKEDKIFIKRGMLIILGISVSIDALVIGFTVLHKIASNVLLLTDTVFIGLVTLFMSTVAFFLSRNLRKFKLISRYADYFGGGVLVFFALKMIFF